MVNNSIHDIEYLSLTCPNAKGLISNFESLDLLISGFSVLYTF